MSPATASPDVAASPARTAAIVDAQRAMSELLGAERRLRARDQQQRDRMTYAQSRALIALAEIGGADADVSAGQLARAADLHPASVTAMLDLVPDMFPSNDDPGNTDRKFLEPAAGSGNFLEEILRRKIAERAEFIESTPDDFAGAAQFGTLRPATAGAGPGPR